MLNLLFKVGTAPLWVPFLLLKWLLAFILTLGVATISFGVLFIALFIAFGVIKAI